MPARKASRKASRSKSSKSSRRARPAPRKAATKPSRPAKANGAAGKANGSNATGQPAMRTLTGQLVVGPAAKALDWYAKVFGGKELSRMPGPDGSIMHATMQVGDTVFMVSDPFGGTSPGELNGAFLHIQHKDIQKMWDRAVADGATVKLPLAPQFWGDNYGQLRDPFGQLWSFGWPANLTEAQKQKLQAEAMKQMAATPA